MTRTIRLVVAEDDLLVREGVVALLETQSDLEVAATAWDYESLLRVVDDARPDVVLTDIRMPPSHTDEGVRAARVIAGSRPGTGIVVLSQYDDPTYAIALLEDGTDGRAYVLKERINDVRQLSDVIRTVAKGGSHVDSKVVGRLVAGERGEESPLEWLTERETEVLAEIAQGKDNSAIADFLVINVRSVEKHINSIFAKLGLSEAEGVSRRVAAVLLFLDSNQM